MPAFSGRACARALRHALMLALVLPAFAAVSAGAAAPEGFYGVNSGAGVLHDAGLRENALARMAAGGLSYVRVDASWGGIEPAPPDAGVHKYVWTVSDAWVSDLARFGLRWYPMLGYSASWASSVPADPFAPPADDSDYATFVAAFAARYGSGGSFWATHPTLPQLPVKVYGIWNEPSNSTFWHGRTATPARYMKLYLAGRAAIKAVDPAARVATAGILDSGVTDGAGYLRAMLDGVPGAGAQIDAVGWHPYVGNVNQVLASVGRARTLLARYGLAGTPIEISETGVVGYTPEQRATWLHDLAMKLPNASLGVTRFMPYVWQGDPMWQISGPDGGPGPIGSAYFAGINDAIRYAPPAPPAPARVPATPVSTRKAPTTKNCTRVKVTRTTTKDKAAKKTKATPKCATKIT